MNENIFKNANGTLNIDLVCERWVYDRFYLVSNSVSGELVIRGDLLPFIVKNMTTFSYEKIKIPISQGEVQEIAKRINLVFLEDSSAGYYYSIDEIKNRIKKLEFKKVLLENDISETEKELEIVNANINTLKNSLKNE